MTRQGAVSGGRYRMANEGQASQHGLMGMYILKDGAGCQVYRPTWNGTRTVIRPWPGRNPENTAEWDPFRLSAQPRDFGDWIRRYTMATSLGNPGITFITKDPTNRAVDDQQNPVWMLYRAINQAVKTGNGLPSWPPLLMGAAGRSAPLAQPKDGYVMQGILMEHKSVPCSPPKGCQMSDRPVVMLMPQSAGSTLLDRLEEQDTDGNLRWPDIAALDGGMFIQFHQAGTQSRASGQPRSMTSLIGTGSGGAADNRYEVEFLETYGNITPSFDGIEALAEAHIRPWDDIIRIPTIEEQVGLICTAGIPASAVVYALGDVYGEYIPQHVFEKARQETGGPAPRANGTVVGAATANPMMRQRSAPQPVAAPLADEPEAPAAPAAAEPTPEAQGYDQPTHAEPSRSKATQEALTRVRRRQTTQS